MSVQNTLPLAVWVYLPDIDDHEAVCYKCGSKEFRGIAQECRCITCGATQKMPPRFDREES